jgi:hypothetical protein
MKNSSDNEAEMYLTFAYKQLEDGIKENKESIAIGYREVDEREEIQEYYIYRQSWKDLCDILLGYATEFEKYEWCDKINQLKQKI